MSEHEGWSVVPNWVIRSNRLHGTEKLLYIALLNRANKRGECWPSLALLCEDVDVSRRTVIEKLKSLEAHGLVKKISRRDKDGSRDSNLYRVFAWEGGADSAPGSADGNQGVVQSSTGGSANEHQEVLPTEVLPNQVLPNSSSEVATATHRPEVQSLLDLLDSEIQSNGGKPTGHTKRNQDEMRRLIDIDGRTPEQIAACIRWCQQDSFWKANILSAAKLREKYDTLRLQALRPKAPERQTPSERAAQTMSIGRAPLATDLQLGEIA